MNNNQPRQAQEHGQQLEGLAWDRFMIHTYARQLTAVMNEFAAKMPQPQAFKKPKKFLAAQRDHAKRTIGEFGVILSASAMTRYKTSAGRLLASNLDRAILLQQHALVNLAQMTTGDATRAVNAQQAMQEAATIIDMLKQLETTDNANEIERALAALA